MDGELRKLPEDAPAPGASKTRRFVLAVIVGLLLMGGGAGVLVVRAKSSRNVPPAHDLNQPRGLKLAETKVTFAAGVMQTVDLRLPCSGRLSIDLTFPKGSTLCAFLVSAEEREKMKARQTFAHVEGFDAKTSSGSHQQAAQLPPGRYTLVLLDESVSRSVVQVSARLSDLK